MKQKSPLMLADSLYYFRGSLDRTTPVDDTSLLSMESCLRSAIDRGHCLLLGYCILPSSFHLALRTSNRGLGVFSMALQVALQNMPITALRMSQCQSIWVDESLYLKDLIQYIHYIPEHIDSRLRYDRYRASSHAAYQNPGNFSWIATDRLNQQLKRHGLNYAALMQTPPDHFPELQSGNHQHFLAWVAPELISASYASFLPKPDEGILSDSGISAQLRRWNHLRQSRKQAS